MTGHSTLAEHLHAEVNVVVSGVNLLCDGSLFATTATDVATYMVGVHMIGKRNSKAYYDVLTSVNIRHDSYLRALEHRMIEEMIHH